MRAICGCASPGIWAGSSGVWSWLLRMQKITRVNQQGFNDYRTFRMREMLDCTLLKRGAFLSSIPASARCCELHEISTWTPCLKRKDINICISLQKGVGRAAAVAPGCSKVGHGGPGFCAAAGAAHVADWLRRCHTRQKGAQFGGGGCSRGRCGGRDAPCRVRHRPAGPAV